MLDKKWLKSEIERLRKLAEGHSAVTVSAAQMRNSLAKQEIRLKWYKAIELDYIAEVPDPVKDGKLLFTSKEARENELIKRLNGQEIINFPSEHGERIEELHSIHDRVRNLEAEVREMDATAYGMKYEIKALIASLNAMGALSYDDASHMIVETMRPLLKSFQDKLDSI